MKRIEYYAESPLFLALCAFDFLLIIHDLILIHKIIG